MEVAVSFGSARDIDSLEHLWLQMLEHHRSVLAGRITVRAPAESWAMCRAAYATMLEGESFLVLARAKGQLIGYALCSVEAPGPTFDFGGPRGDLHSLVVDEGARGEGAGSRLLEACRAELLRRGCRHWTVGVVESNVDAVRLYERSGFRPWLREMAAPLE